MIEQYNLIQRYNPNKYYHLALSGPWSNGNEEVLYIYQSFENGTLSDAVLYPTQNIRMYVCVEGVLQPVYFQAPSSKPNG